MMKKMLAAAAVAATMAAPASAATIYESYAAGTPNRANFGPPDDYRNVQVGADDQKLFPAQAFTTTGFSTVTGFAVDLRTFDDGNPTGTAPVNQVVDWYLLDFFVGPMSSTSILASGTINVSGGSYATYSVTLGSAIAAGSPMILALNFNNDGTPKTGVQWEYEVNHGTDIVGLGAPGNAPSSSSIPTQIVNGIKWRMLQEGDMALAVYGDAAPVPEPATLALAGLGLAAAGFRARRAAK